MRPSQLLMVLAAAALMTACGRSPEATVERFYVALGKGEVTEAKSLVSKQITAMAGDAKIQQALFSAAQQIQSKGGVRKVEVALTGQGEVRSGTALVTYGDDKFPPHKDKVKVVKEDGSWKITGEK